MRALGFGCGLWMSLVRLSVAAMRLPHGSGFRPSRRRSGKALPTTMAAGLCAIALADWLRAGKMRLSAGVWTDAV